MPKRRAGSVDLELGRNIRVIRERRGLSQERLAERIGLTFQQLQKYESGENRVSASRLYQLARAFDVPVGAFFSGPAPHPGEDTAMTDAKRFESFVLSSEGRELMESFASLSDMRLRVQLIRVIKTLGED